MTSPGQGPNRQIQQRPLWSTILIVVVAIGLYYANQKGLLGRKSPPIGSTQPPAPKVEPLPVPTSPTTVDARPSTIPRKPNVPSGNLPSSDVRNDGGIKKLFDGQKSYQIVTASGRVVKLLPDDVETGDGTGQHQKFLVELNTGITIRLVNNIEFSRVPVAEGDTVTFRGEYIYNEKGGTVHWTHHDPRGRHENGWVEHNGKKYD